MTYYDWPQCPLWNCGSVANSYHQGSVPRSLGTWGLIVWLYRTVSLSPVCIVSRDPFSLFSEASTREALRRVVLDVRSVYARLFAAGTSFVTIWNRCYPFVFVMGLPFKLLDVAAFWTVFWLSLASLYARNGKALRAYTKWAELVHDSVGISGNDPRTALLLLAKHKRGKLYVALLKSYIS